MKANFPGQVVHLYYNGEQTKVLTSVACYDVYTVLLPTEAVSIREIAAELGKSAASVGEQMNKLLEAGLAITAGTQKRRSRTEQLYALSCMSASYSTDELSKEMVELISKQFRAHMRAADRLQAKYIEARGHENSFRLFGYHVWSSVYISPENSIKLREAMGNLHDLINQLAEPEPENRKSGNYVRVKMTTMMFPSISESKKVIDEHS